MPDNAASLGVSRRLGYAENGVSRTDSPHGVVELRHLRLTRETWRAAGHRVAVDGLEPCLAWFGLRALTQVGEWSSEHRGGPSQRPGRPDSTPGEAQVDARGGPSQRPGRPNSTLGGQAASTGSRATVRFLRRATATPTSASAPPAYAIAGGASPRNSTPITMVSGGTR